MSHQTKTILFSLCVGLLWIGSGCSTMHSSATTDSSPQFERGQPNVVIDGVGWVFGVPSRIALWNWGVENHNISPETEAQIHEYVVSNGLQDVKVRLNQYDPGGEWRRLTQNKRVSPAWRYTLGAVSTVGYTLLPGRVLGSDHYNPFTNTISVYSDVPSLGMHAAGYAKDVHQRTYPGTYAVGQLFPGVNLVHETIATRDVLDYVAQRGDVSEQQEAIHVLYPRYGGAVGGAVESFVPVGGVIQLGGLVAGHATGRFKTRGLDYPIAESDIEQGSTTSPIQTVGHEEAATLISE